MTKDEVILILNSEKKEDVKYYELVRTLDFAPYKNLSLISHYSRQAYTKNRYNLLVYDVKKAWSISKPDLNLVASDELQVASSDSGEEKKDFDIETALDVDFSTLNYHKELKPLANDVADFLGEELESQKKADLIAYLEEKKLKKKD